jgi:hypothetical protein
MQYPPLPAPLDPNFVVHLVSRLAPLLVLLVGVRLLFRSAVGDALAERIRARTGRGWGGNVAGEDHERVAALEAQVSQLQGQVSELAERVDFAERMLAERRERKLGAGQ